MQRDEWNDISFENWNIYPYQMQITEVLSRDFFWINYTTLGINLHYLLKHTNN